MDGIFLSLRSSICDKCPQFAESAQNLQKFWAKRDLLRQNSITQSFSAPTDATIESAGSELVNSNIHGTSECFFVRSSSILRQSAQLQMSPCRHVFADVYYFVWKGEYGVHLSIISSGSRRFERAVARYKRPCVSREPASSLSPKHREHREKHREHREHRENIVNIVPAGHSLQILGTPSANFGHTSGVDAP